YEVRPAGTRCDARHRGDDAVHRVAALRVVAARESLVDERDDRVDAQTVLRGRAHDLRLADELGEDVAEAVVAAHQVGDGTRIPGQRSLARRAFRTGQLLHHVLCGYLRRFHGRGDALAVVRAHHPALVAHQQHPVADVLCAVDAYVKSLPA